MTSGRSISVMSLSNSVIASSRKDRILRIVAEGVSIGKQYQAAFIHIASLPASLQDASLSARLRRTNSTPPSLQDAALSHGDASLSLSSWSRCSIFECNLV